MNVFISVLLAFDDGFCKQNIGFLSLMLLLCMSHDKAFGKKLGLDTNVTAKKE